MFARKKNSSEKDMKKTDFHLSEVDKYELVLISFISVQYSSLLTDIILLNNI